MSHQVKFVFEQTFWWRARNEIQKLSCIQSRLGLWTIQSGSETSGSRAEHWFYSSPSQSVSLPRTPWCPKTQRTLTGFRKDSLFSASTHCKTDFDLMQLEAITFNAAWLSSQIQMRFFETPFRYIHGLFIQVPVQMLSPSKRSAPRSTLWTSWVV